MSRASLSDVRKKNKEIVKKAIFDQPNISRVELAEYTGLSGGTITNLVNELLAAGEIVESMEQQSTGGRKRVGLIIQMDTDQIVLFEIKQRSISYKSYSTSMMLMETKVLPTNYISGNTVVEFIVGELGKLEKKPVKIGLLIDENMNESELSYMLSTGLSQDNIPIRDALKMFKIDQVEIEFTSQYHLEEEIANAKLEGIENYIYTTLDYEMTAQIYMNGKLVSHSGQTVIPLSNLLHQLGLLDKWREVFHTAAFMKNSQTLTSTGKSHLSLKKSPQKSIAEITASVLAMILNFYRLDAVFMVGKGAAVPGMDHAVHKLLSMKSERLPEHIYVLGGAEGDYSDNMVRRLTEQVVFGS